MQRPILQVQLLRADEVVEPLLRDELVVRALLDDRPAVEHDDDVRMANRRQPVRDHQHGAARERGVKVLDETPLRLVVEGGGRFVEDDHPGLLELLDVRMPIFNREADAQVAQVDVSLRQLELQLKAQQQSIMVEVANVYETVLLQRRVLEVARQVRQLSQEQVDGEMARFEVGFTTTFEVLRYQRDLAEAQVRELRAIIDYQIAVAALRKATGINFDEHDVTLAKTAR